MRSLQFRIMRIVFIYIILSFGRKQTHLADSVTPQEAHQKAQRSIKLWCAGIVIYNVLGRRVCCLLKASLFDH